MKRAIGRRHSSLVDSFPLIVLIVAVVVATALSVVSVLAMLRSWHRVRSAALAEPGALPTAGFGPPPARPKRSRWTFAAYGLAVILAAPAAYYAVVVLSAHTDRPRADRERGFALPFIGLQSPRGVAVDAKGNVYVADNTDSRVFELMTGSNTQTVLPFTGLHEPTGVAWMPLATSTCPTSSTAGC
jgi:DNA-binding beta-propeller fold protein YncE